MINLEKFKHKSWLDGRIVAINADCEAVMAAIGGKEIDLVLTDPPYGIGVNKGGYSLAGNGNFKGGNFKVAARKYDGGEWDKNPPNQSYFDALLKISHNQIIWGANHFISRIALNSSCWIVWDKDNGESYQADCELAWTSFDGAVRKFLWRWHGLLQQNMKDKDERMHPTQKPVALMAWCLNNYSKENDLIFDAFSGSFTTAIACIRTNRRFIGCELDPIYFEKACERIDTELKQLTLF